MSQAGMLNTAGGPSPPNVPTSFVTDNGTGVPAANILVMHGYDSSENNVFGITAKGGAAAGNPPGTGTANEVDYYLTNRLHGNAQTVGAVIANIITFTPPLTAGTYKLSYQVAAYNSTDGNGAGYELEGTVVADGLGALSTQGTPVRIMNGNTTVFDVNLVDVVFSGSSIILQATGVAAKTIRWTGVLNFIFGGA